MFSLFLSHFIKQDIKTQGIIFAFGMIFIPLTLGFYFLIVDPRPTAEETANEKAKKHVETEKFMVEYKWCREKTKAIVDQVSTIEAADQFMQKYLLYGKRDELCWNEFNVHKNSLEHRKTSMSRVLYHYFKTDECNFPDIPTPAFKPPTEDVLRETKK